MKPMGSASSSRLLIVTLIAGALASVIVLALMYLAGVLGSGGNSLRLHFFLEPDTFPAHAMREVEESVSTRAVPGQGTATLYAEARASTQAYYLLSGPLPGQVTLYRANLAAPDAGLEQLSGSETLKLGLSVHEIAGVAAYTSGGEGEGSRITVFDLATRTETILSEGTRPTVLADGRSILFEQDGALVLSGLTGEPRELLRLPAGAVFAADRETSEVAVYDPARENVTRYWITDGALTPGSSAAVQGAKELFYAQGTLYAAHMEGDTLLVRVVGGEGQAIISAPGLSLDGYRVTAL